MRSYFWIIALIILISGCVSPFGAGGSSNSGVSINSFSFSPASMKSNQLTKLFVSIENRGDYNIETDEGYIFIFGLPNDWTVSDKSDMDAFSSTFGLLGAQNRAGKVYPGEKTDFQWILRAPQNLPKDEVFSFNAQARVCYPYKTKVWGRLEVISEDSWLQDQPKESKIIAEQTKGPLKVDFLSSQPIVEESEVIIKIRITNAGDGTVTINPCSIFETGGSDDEVENLNKLGDIEFGGASCYLQDNELYLQKGQTKETEIVCTPPSLDNSPTKTEDFTMEISYNYYSDSKASVSVKGTSETGTAGYGGTGGTGSTGTTGGGTTSVIQLKDQCTAVCTKSGTSYFGGARYAGYCNTITFDKEPLSGEVYPVKFASDSVDVLLKSPAYSGVKLTDVQTKSAATISDLSIHKAEVGDFNILDLTLGDIDEKTFSKQYSKLSGVAGTTKIGIVDYLCKVISDARTITLDKKTKGELCRGDHAGMYATQLKNLQGINGKDLTVQENIDAINKASISRFRITDILGINVNDMDLDIDYIQADQFYIAHPKLNGQYGALKYSNCKYGDTNYVRTESGNEKTETRCMCITDVGGITTTAGITDASTTSTCSQACSSKSSLESFSGGACLKTPQVSGTYLYDGATECKSGTLYTYTAKKSTLQPYGCDANDLTAKCYCYNKKSLSLDMQGLLCGSSAASVTSTTSSGGDTKQGSSTATSAALEMEIPGDTIKFKEEVIIKVTSNNVPVAGAEIKIGSNSIGTTDGSGILKYTSQDTVYSNDVAVASKSGYTSVSKTIRIVGAFADFTAQDITITPSTVSVGEPVTVKSKIKNVGTKSANLPVTLLVDDNYFLVDGKNLEQSVSLAVGEVKEITFTIKLDKAKSYKIDLLGKSGTLTVNAPATTPTDTATKCTWASMGSINPGILYFVLNIDKLVEGSTRHEAYKLSVSFKDLTDVAKCEARKEPAWWEFWVSKCADVGTVCKDTDCSHTADEICCKLDTSSVKKMQINEITSYDNIVSTPVGLTVFGPNGNLDINKDEQKVISLNIPTSTNINHPFTRGDTLTLKYDGSNILIDGTSGISRCK